MSLSVCAPVMRCKAQKARSDAASEKLEKPGYRVAKVHVIHDIIAQCLHRPVLQVEGDSHIIFSGTQCESLWLKLVLCMTGFPSETIPSR